MRLFEALGRQDRCSVSTIEQRPDDSKPVRRTGLILWRVRNGGLLSQYCRYRQAGIQSHPGSWLTAVPTLPVPDISQALRSGLPLQADASLRIPAVERPARIG